ncbi:MAG: sulfur carrier protein ThiS [Lentisphaerae bacterium ADurb.Bin242]|nr:MAG: sulfur carrier protein ThiS [Lentisphaerae bacterium ADurb.Bin242]
MVISFNSEKVVLPEKTSLADFLAEHSIRRENVILEYNSEVIPRNRDLSGFLLSEGDEINVYKVVAGG